MKKYARNFILFTMAIIFSINVHTTFALQIEADQVIFEQPDHDTWTKITFDTPFDVTPTVVAGVTSYQGAQGLTVRIQNVSKTGFDVKMHEWDYLDGYHVEEIIAYIAVTNENIIGPSTNLHAFEVSLNHNWKTIYFNDFTAAPVVLTQIVTYNGTSAGEVRQRNLTQNSVELMIAEEEGNDGLRADDTVNVIAMSEGKFTFNSRRIFVGTTSTTMDHDFKEVAFGSSVKSPIMVANMQTTYGTDAASVRLKNLTSNNVQIMVQEEQSKDSEVTHADERVGYVAIESVPYAYSLTGEHENNLTFSMPGIKNLKFRLGQLMVSEGQEHNDDIDVGVGMFSGEPRGYLEFTSGRHATAGVAQAFNAYAGTGARLNDVSSLVSPGELNFYFSGDLTLVAYEGAGSTRDENIVCSNMAMGQGSGNDWWLSSFSMLGGSLTKGIGPIEIGANVGFKWCFRDNHIFHPILMVFSLKGHSEVLAVPVFDHLLGTSHTAIKQAGLNLLSEHGIELSVPGPVLLPDPGPVLLPEFN